MVRTISNPFVAASPREARTVRRSGFDVSLFDGLGGDGDEEHALVRPLGDEAQPAHEDRAAALDAVVGMQLAAVRGVLAEQLEVHLDAAVVAHLARLELQAARAAQLALALLLPFEVGRFLGDEAEGLGAEVLGELAQVLRDGRELWIDRAAVGSARRGDGPDGDAALLLSRPAVRRYGLRGCQEQQGPESKAHCCTGESSSTQMVVVAPFCMTMPSWFSKSISSMDAPVACAWAISTGPGRCGARNNASARQPARATPAPAESAARWAPHISDPHTENGADVRGPSRS